MTVSVTPLSDAIGVELSSFPEDHFRSPAAAGQCLELLGRYGVVVYREAHISDTELVTFSRMLGEVVPAGVGSLPDFPEISPVTLDPAKSKLARLRRSTIFWHVDGLTDDVPQKATLLTAKDVADDGGDTEFANTYAAFDTLPEARKKELSSYRVLHSMAATQLLMYPDPTPEQTAKWDTMPSHEHPLVWRHEDGRSSLLVGATTGHVIGMEAGESRALLDDVLEWATRPEFVLRHHWHVGDLVVWDNTGMLHRALPYEPTSRRLMYRTTLRGEEAVR
ncbi:MULTISPECIES: TauD/TfdA family dioxygenase [unclassified Mycobacterium]|uniref:TauD/TfdA dioxygenase family protein n=1 Tax=unclassified Mycobacterium TaxID=2642494 RepID=UPI0029C8B9FD|nr:MULTISPECIES: TauD/TfdA family dioxygenase [unclassified Mycobacterium]